MQLISADNPFSPSLAVCRDVALCLLVLLGWGQPLPIQASESALDTAYGQLQRGEYAESRERFQQLLADAEFTGELRVRAAIGLSRVEAETGRWEEAIEVIESALESERNSSRLWSRLAELHFETGESTRAAREVQRALDLDSQNLHARLIRAHLDVERGAIDEALDGYRFFVRHYNRAQPDDWETLMIIGEGAAQYARWESVSPIFRFLVNTLCPDALKDNPHCWQAAVLSGTLLLEKYNQGQALPEFEQALKINPHCVPALVAMGEAALQDQKLTVAESFADKALETNPRFVPALLLKADVQLMAGNDGQALKQMQAALEVNGRDQRILARLAVIELFSAGLPEPESLRQWIDDPENAPAVGGLAATSFGELRQRNPRPGPFYAILGEFLDARRKYDHAEVCYRAAIDVMPQLSAPKTSLGMLCMRTGRIEEAETILDDAFQADPFHVRVSNMRKVIGVLKSYETIETEHFVLRVDGSEMVLGRQMADYLESIYPELTARYGYEPPTRTQFEIYSDAKGQSGHAWFSARMVGLPWIQTIGASTGVIVALASPTKTDRPYNWARVLRHEFVHVLTLQKTRFNIPHWFTEAISVTEEGQLMPESWQEMLLERVPAGKVFSLTSLNDGFQKPASPSDWSMAYCQSKLYADLMLNRFGEDALVRLLDAYVETPDDEAAFQRAFSVPLEEFEAEYTRFLHQQIEEIARGRRPLPVLLDAAKERVEAEPENPAALADLGFALLRSGQRREAAERIDRALELKPTQSLACALRARRLALDEDLEGAFQLLQRGFEDETPHPLLLELLARDAVRREEFALAETVLDQALERFPLETEFVRLKIAVAEGLNHPDEQIVPYLKRLARREYDDAPSRKRLARVAAAGGDDAEAVIWAREALSIDPLDAGMLRILAEAERRSRNLPAAVGAFELIVQLEDATDDDRYALAGLYKRSGRTAEARRQLNAILEHNPNHRPARTMLRLLDQGL
jgi:cellulose synthase operon protein C